MKWLPAAAAVLALGACGDRQMLTPRMGRSLPPKPDTAPVALNADQLLNESATERPGRSDELLIRSQVRRDDTYDLPPQ